MFCYLASSLCFLFLACFRAFSHSSSFLSPHVFHLPGSSNGFRIVLLLFVSATIFYFLVFFSTPECFICSSEPAYHIN